MMLPNEGESESRTADALNEEAANISKANLLGISNVNSYYWVTDITNTQHAVPNYLTGRQINARLSLKF